MMKRATVVVLVLCAACAACDTPDRAKPEAVDAAPPPENTFRITANAPAPTVSAPAAAATIPVPLDVPSAAPTAVTKAPGAAKAGAVAAAASSAPAQPEPAPLKGAATHLSGKNFTLDVSSPCRVDTPCAVTLRIAAVGDYHVNKEYPYKFTATPAAGIAFLGNGDPNTFSRSAGDFHEDGEKTGTMTVRLKPSAPGSANVAGTYKMSICSAEQCQIESQAVSLAVPVL